MTTRIVEAHARVGAAAKLAQQLREDSQNLDLAVLSAAFRGELVPQDPNDEPADALLARLRAAAPADKPTRRGRTRE